MNQLSVHNHVQLNTLFCFLNGLIITRESVVENVSDPSEGQDWNWED